MQQPDNHGYAFFDVDETILNFKSMFSFRQYLFQASGHAINSATAFFQELHVMASRCDRSEVNRWFYRSLTGYTPAEISETVGRWYQELQHTDSPIYISKTLDFLETLRGQGIEPVFVSGSSDFILAPFAKALKIRHLLCGRLVVEDGRYTGELLHQPVIGEGKRLAVTAFAEQYSASLQDAYAVGDHLSDLPMLESVGHPAVVAGHAKLEAIAHERAWPVL